MIEWFLVAFMALVCMAFGAIIVWSLLLLLERLLEVRRRTCVRRSGFDVDVAAIRKYLAEIEELRKHGVDHGE